VPSDELALGKLRGHRELAAHEAADLQIYTTANT